ncbi:hypothetical protein CS006_02710 [Bifidobacterium primatium]|uniref:Uncharacterized protein n=2 Tax=Bifidobacterium primatium TaxID=2045438 RepID=A0A2M9HB80_9BIFI|nr:hypothetical protein CS006_02710 [Bifidobacterium primatium]
MAIIAIIIIAILPMPAYNVHYSLTYDQSLPSSTKVIFQFDDNAAFPESARQQASIQGSVADIRLDTLNADSHNLRIITTGTRAKPVHLDISVNIFNEYRPTAYSISVHQTSSNGFVRISPSELTTMQHAAQHLSIIRVALLMLTAMLWLIALIRVTIGRSLQSAHFYAGVAIVLVTLWLIRCISALPSLDYSRFPYRSLAAGILLGFLVLIGINMHRYANNVHKTMVIVIDYVTIAAYILAQFLIYIKYFPRDYDESAHMSYVAYEKIHHELFPTFENIKIYEDAYTMSGTMDLSSFHEFNQLGHPPLYYLIMSIMPGITRSSGTVEYHINWLRASSFGIGFLGILLAMYLGYTRISKKSPILHLVFATVLIAPANFVFVMSGVNNDTLCFLTVSIFTWGMLRFRERKFDYVTFLLIVVGMSTSLLTKLTAGMITSFIGLFALIATIRDEQIRTVLKSRQFLISIPLYLPPVVYYTRTLLHYHAIQPSYQKLDPYGYYHSTFYYALEKRSELDVFAYIKHFGEGIMRSWWSMPWQPDITRSHTSSLTFDALAVSMLVFIPIVIFAVQRNRLGNTLAMAMAALIITLFQQFSNALKGFYVNGYTGGTQSRYYLCAMVFLAMTVVWMMAHWFGRDKRDDRITDESDDARGNIIGSITPTGQMVCAAFVMWLVYDGFLSSFLLHMAEIQH